MGVSWGGLVSGDGLVKEEDSVERGSRGRPRGVPCEGACVWEGMGVQATGMGRQVPSWAGTGEIMAKGPRGLRDS